MSRRKLALVAVAAVAAVAGILLLVAAVDVLRVPGDVRADDSRYAARPARQEGLWNAPGILPGAMAVRLLGLADDLAYRRASLTYTRIQPGKVAIDTPELEAEQAAALGTLTEASRVEQDPIRRARLLTMLGVVTVSRFSQDPTERQNILRSAIGLFESALDVDPTNDDAKFDLELVLRNYAESGFAGSGADRGSSKGSGAGIGRSGSGY
jgi:hypothetical protein